MTPARFRPDHRLHGMRGRACFCATERAGPTPLTLVSLVRLHLILFTGCVIRVTTAHQLSSLFWPSFELRDGVILLTGTPTPELSRFDTLSEAEAFYSHTHVFDCFRHAIPSVHNPEWDTESPNPTHAEFALAWDLAKRMGHMWLSKLVHDFPQARFRVYVTKLDEPIVRYHRVRENEADWYRDDSAGTQIACGEVVIYDSRHNETPAA